MRGGTGQDDVSTLQGYASHMHRWPYKMSCRPAVTLVASMSVGGNVGLPIVMRIRPEIRPAA